MCGVCVGGKRGDMRQPAALRKGPSVRIRAKLGET